MEDFGAIIEWSQLTQKLVDKHGADTVKKYFNEMLNNNESSDSGYDGYGGRKRYKRYKRKTRKRSIKKRRTRKRSMKKRRKTKKR